MKYIGRISNCRKGCQPVRSYSKLKNTISKVGNLRIPATILNARSIYYFEYFAVYVQVKTIWLSAEAFHGQHPNLILLLYNV